MLEKFGLRLSQKMVMFEGMMQSHEPDIHDLEASLEAKSEKNRPLLMEIVERMFGTQEGESEEIEESIQGESSEEKKEDVQVESAGTSQGYDQSVNSLAMEDFDYVELVKKNTREIL
jgi:hypothetical protein